MKKLLSSFILITIVTLCMGQSKQKDSITAICKQRGHVFKAVNNTANEEGGTVIYAGGWETYPINRFERSIPPEDTTKNKLIDTPDSSYIVRIPDSEFKKCYRCGESIEFKKKPIFIEIIWRKNN